MIRSPHVKMKQGPQRTSNANSTETSQASKQNDAKRGGFDWTLRESDYGKVGVVQLIGCTLRWGQPIGFPWISTHFSRGLMDETPASAGSSTRPWFDVVGHMFSSSFESGWPRVQSENSGKAEYSPWKKFIRAMQKKDRVPHGAR